MALLGPGETELLSEYTWASAVCPRANQIGRMEGGRIG